MSLNFEIHEPKLYRQFRDLVDSNPKATWIDRDRVKSVYVLVEGEVVSTDEKDLVKEIITREGKGNRLTLRGLPGGTMGIIPEKGATIKPNFDDKTVEIGLMAGSSVQINSDLGYLVVRGMPFPNELLRQNGF